ncbi:RNA-splicing factor [Tulasnella sp. 330]|nr:RNA-splicing factor [Tulasnella sp. 330]
MAKSLRAKCKKPHKVIKRTTAGTAYQVTEAARLQRLNARLVQKLTEEPEPAWKEEDDLKRDAEEDVYLDDVSMKTAPSIIKESSKPEIEAIMNIDEKVSTSGGRDTSSERWRKAKGITRRKGKASTTFQSGKWTSKQMFCYWWIFTTISPSFNLSMFNGIGLTTPRGSGTNGYVQRNLSHLRPKDDNYNRNANFDDLKGPRMREPDQGILDHERKRQVEVKCLELQVELEDKELPEEEIETQVSALRTRLLENLSARQPPTSAKTLKAYDTHGLAVAKKAELSRMALALGTSVNYQEGDAFNKDKQEALKQQRAIERAETEKRKQEQRELRDREIKAEKDRLDEEAKLRRRKEYYEKLEREKRSAALPPAGAPTGPRGAGARNEERTNGRAGRDRSRSLSRSRSRSPAIRRRSPLPDRRRKPIAPDPDLGLALQPPGAPSADPHDLCLAPGHHHPDANALTTLLRLAAHLHAVVRPKIQVSASPWNEGFALTPSSSFGRQVWRRVPSSWISFYVSLTVALALKVSVAIPTAQALPAAEARRLTR